MFLKNSQLSIRWRLTLVFTGVLAATLLVLGIATYVIMARNLTREVDRSIYEKAEEIKGNMNGGKGFLRHHLLLPSLNVLAMPDVFVQIVDLEGQVVAKSANLGSQELPLGQGQNTGSLEGSRFSTFSLGEMGYRQYLTPIILDGSPVAVLQVARSLRSVDLPLRRLQFILWGLGGMALLLAGYAGWFLARAALSPMDEMTRTARQIGETRDLSRRLEYAGPGDEVGNLAATFNLMLEQLEKAYRELEEAYAAQGRFVADASHELRTPLTTIRGNIELLQKTDFSDPAQRREAEADIAAEAERMTRLVNDLLLLARADAGQSLDLEPVEAGPILQAAAKRAPFLNQGKASFQVEGLERLEGLVINASPDHLQQLLLILLDNAFKYSPDGWVTLSAGREGDRLVIGVEDSGTGISPEDLPHIFERFYRSDKARTRTGTGLGLAIARWITQEHGGEITVESELGQGTTFNVALPAGESAPRP